MPPLPTKGKKHVNELRKHVFDYLIKRNGKKYKSFLRYLRIFKYASLSPTRGEFLELYYVLMRYLDDIADGDLPAPVEYGNSVTYLQSKIDFSINPQNPTDDIDLLFLHCFDLAKRFNEEFNQETGDILNSLLFDAKRHATGRVFPRQELMDHFHAMDIRGTIRATLKIFKDDPENYRLLEPLGLATRFHYDLQDFESDIAAGYINIPLEDVIEFDIDINCLQDRFSPNVYRWFIKQALNGLEYLDLHKVNLRTAKLSLLARATFPLVYVNPARKYFNQVLRECPPEYRGEIAHLKPLPQKNDSQEI